MKPEVRAKIDALPDSPGVYLMKAGEEIIYVGKAKSLRDRWRSYTGGSDERAFVALLHHLLTDLDVVLTRSNKEALLLENELIKTHHPRFNVKLVDDKRFLCLRLDSRKPYPRLELVRRFHSDRARYFGPYHSATAIRRTLGLVNRYFHLRTCSDQVMKNRRRPCLQYQIERCPAPCVYEVHEAYQQSVADVAQFLEGKKAQLVESLRARMQQKSAALEFEQAAKLRDQIAAVERSLERQQIVSPDRVDRDVVGFFRQGTEVEIQILRTRDGRLTEPQRFSFSDQELPDAELVSDFASRYYVEGTPAEGLPKEILFGPEMDWGEALAQCLSERAGHRIRVAVPQRGDKRRQVELAQKNAAQSLADQQRQKNAAEAAAKRLQRLLHLQRLPELIECVDVSHMGGEEIVASVVRLERGQPNKDLYRHYKIRSTDGQDDFRSMYEVVSRRGRRGLEEADLPDLLVVDGGKGQLNAARAALDDHGIDGLDLVGLAKARRDNDASATRTFERIFVQGQKEPIIPKQNAAELFLLTRARDEAHRFAVRFHRQKKRQKIKRSRLDEIKGIGPKRRRALLKSFGSLARILEASEKEIAAVVGNKTASAVVAGLRDLR